MSDQEVYMYYAGELEKLASLVDMADEEIQEKFAADALGGHIAARSFDETMEKLGRSSISDEVARLVREGMSKAEAERILRSQGIGGGGYAVPLGVGAGALALGGGGYALYRHRQKHAEAMEKLAAMAKLRGAWDSVKGWGTRLKDSDVVQGARNNPYITGGALSGAAGLGAAGSYMAFGRRKKESE